MILTLAVLLVACAVARFLFARYTGNVVAATVVAVAIFCSFIAGSLTHVVAIPDAAQSSAVATADPPVSAPVTTAAPEAAATEVVSTAPADPAPQPDASLKNVTSRCRNAAATHAVDAAGAIDVFTSDVDSIRVADGVSLDGSRAFNLEGWAAGRGSKTPALAACLIVDGRVATNVIDLYGVRREDVADALGAKGLASSGYRIVIPKRALAAGNHAIRVSVLEQDGSFAFIGAKPVQITAQ